MPPRMTKLKEDPFLGAIEDRQRIEEGLQEIGAALRENHV